MILDTYFARLKNWRSFKAYKEDIPVLEQVINQFYDAESITVDESKKNLEESVVQIDCEESTSNGLLITDHGYFISAYHCLKGKTKKKIVTSSGDKFSIERICAYNEDSDVVIAKADIPKERNPRCYKLFNFFQHGAMARRGIGTVLISRKKDLVIKGGKLTVLPSKFEKQLKEKYHLAVNMALEPGDSGSPLVTVDEGRLIGFAVFMYEGTSFGGVVSIEKAFALLQRHIYHKKQQYGI